MPPKCKKCSKHHGSDYSCKKWKQLSSPKCRFTQEEALLLIKLILDNAEST